MSVVQAWPHSGSGLSPADGAGRCKQGGKSHSRVITLGLLGRKRGWGQGPGWGSYGVEEDEGVCILELMRADRKGPRRSRSGGPGLGRLVLMGEGKVCGLPGISDAGGGPRDLGWDGLRLGLTHSCLGQGLCTSFHLAR